MNCPKCESSRCYVVDSRPQPDGSRWRRYKCLACKERWSIVSTGDDAKPQIKPPPPQRKLTFAQAEEIMLSSKSTLALAEEYGITHQAISQIRLGQTYADVHRKLKEEGFDVASHGDLLCKDCAHWLGERCDFGFPDAGGDFATDCSLFLAA